MRGVDIYVDRELRGSLSEEQKAAILVENKPKYWMDFVVRVLQDSPLNKEIEEAFGADCIEAYRYAEELFQYRKRTCGNPTLRHSQDCAYRLALSDLDKRYIIAALLHDAVEDKAKTLEEIEYGNDEYNNEYGLEVIARRFGEEVAHDVDMLTNKYSILAKEIEKKSDIKKDDDFETVKDKIYRVLAETESELRGEGLYSRYGSYIEEFRREIDRFTEEEWRNVKRRFIMFNIYDLLKAKSYEMYLREIERDAKKRYRNNDPYYDVPIMVKCVDSIDNMRTTNYLDRKKLDKLVYKSEIRIKSAAGIMRYLNRKNVYNHVLFQRYQHLRSEFVWCLSDFIKSVKMLPDTGWYTTYRHLVEEHKRVIAEQFNGQIPLRFTEKF